ncbi:MAG: RecX family transcriptional regulator [Bacteroidales bacterium]|nr:RecX family transcriptional regulator [Bacteroidales bacterium]
MAEYEKVLSSLQALCVKKECCTSDLQKKAIKALEGDREAADRLLASLVSDKFVDDARYAAAFAREKSSLTGWGPAKISLGLRMKGISRADIDAALAEIDSDRADEKMYKLVRAKAKTLVGDPYIKFKLIKYALSRGYEYDSVETCVSAVMDDMEATEQ